MFIKEDTLDDALHTILTEILKSGKNVSSTKGANIELAGILVEISDPRARLSRTETRGKTFSCLGELLWYLSGSNKLDFINYYIPLYEEYAEEDGIVYGGYGPRIFSCKGDSQFLNVQRLLERKPASRQAVIQIFSKKDLVAQKKDTPCTCTLQFLIRDEQLHLIVCMRSNDAFFGFPHDVFSFTMLQEIMASNLGVDVGKYQHFVGSMHVYQDKIKAVEKFLKEGFQSRLSPMTAMPLESTSESIETLLRFETLLRKGISDPYLSHEFLSLPPYWQDLANLLVAFRSYKNKDINALKSARKKFVSNTFNIFLDRKISKLQDEKINASVSLENITEEKEFKEETDA